jgi:hypothetical protein
MDQCLNPLNSDTISRKFFESHRDEPSKANIIWVMPGFHGKTRPDILLSACPFSAKQVLGYAL